MFTKATGVLLDAVTLTTIAVLATIALAGAADPSIGGGVIPLMVGTFTITLASGTAKIALNRRRNTH